MDPLFPHGCVDTLRRVAGPNELIFRHAIDAMNRGDFDAGVEQLHPEVEWFTSAEWAALGEPVYRGPEDVRELWRTVSEMFDDYRWELQDVAEHGEQLVVSVRWVGSGKASGVGVDRTLHLHCTFRGGELITARTFPTRAQAEASAGPEFGAG
jgi:ketosteroid isomerase-like protein